MPVGVLFIFHSHHSLLTPCQTPSAMPVGTANTFTPTIHDGSFTCHHWCVHTTGPPPPNLRVPITLVPIQGNFPTLHACTSCSKLQYCHLGFWFHSCLSPLLLTDLHRKLW